MVKCGNHCQTWGNRAQQQHTPPTGDITVKNLEIAQIFSEMADILEIKGDNPFKIRAYRRAALNLEGLTKNVEGLAPEYSAAKNERGGLLLLSRFPVHEERFTPYTVEYSGYEALTRTQIEKAMASQTGR